MRVGVTGPEEHGRAAERAGIIPRRARRPDQAAREADHRAEAAGVPCGVFQGEAGALREAQERDALAWDAACEEVGDDRLDPAERRVEIRLVRFEWRQERVRVPGVAGP